MAAADPQGAEALLAARKAEIDREQRYHLDPEGVRLLLIDYCNEYLQHVAPTHKASTQHADRQLAELYILPTLGGMRLRDLRSGIIQRWLDKLIEAYAANTVKRARSLLQRMLARAVVLQYIESNPASNVVTPAPRASRPTRAPRPLTPDEVGRVLAAAAERPTQKTRSGGTQVVSRWHDISIPIWFGLLGLRIGEVCGIQREDVVLTGPVPHLHIRRTISELAGNVSEGTPKTADSIRTIPLPALLVPALRALVLATPAKGYIFHSRTGTVLRPRLLHRAYDAVLKRAKMPQVRFHDLRHTTGATLRALGCQDAVIAAILGHASKSITAHYSQPTLETLAPWVTRMADVYIGAPDALTDARPKTGT